MASLRQKASYRSVRVAKLPYAHNPSRCHHFGEFTRIATGQGKRQPWATRLLGRVAPSVGASAGKRWDREIVSSRHADCPFHQWDIAAANQGAVSLLRAVPDDRWSPDGIREAAAHLALPNAIGACGLLIDPVIWTGGDCVGNGQHRICVARHAGLRTLLVATS